MADPIVRVVGDHRRAAPQPWTWVDAQRASALLRPPVPGAAGGVAGRASGVGSGAQRALARRLPARTARGADRRARSERSHYQYRRGRAARPSKKRSGTSAHDERAAARFQPAAAQPATPLRRTARRPAAQRERDRARQLSLPDVFRGEHTLQVVVIDAAGTEVMRSARARVLGAANEHAQNPNRDARLAAASRPCERRLSGGGRATRAGADQHPAGPFDGAGRTRRSAPRPI